VGKIEKSEQDGARREVRTYRMRRATRAAEARAASKPPTTCITAERHVRFRADGLYTIKEVATILNVSVRSVAKWIADGRLKAFKIGDGSCAPVRIHGRTILALLKRVQKIKRDRDAGGEQSRGEGRR
jgi:excisionase family DNA binding protein